MSNEERKKQIREAAEKARKECELKLGRYLSDLESQIFFSGFLKAIEWNLEEQKKALFETIGG